MLASEEHLWKHEETPFLLGDLARPQITQPAREAWAGHQPHALPTGQHCMRHNLPNSLYQPFRRA